MVLPERHPMALPISTSFEPMNARLVDTIPDEAGAWQYEPKWDGFRCLAFRDGGRVDLRSKSGQPLGRYFPEVVEALLRLKATRFVLDGELVVPEGHALSFDALLQRIHPSESRIKKLAGQTPATFVLFDILADGSGKSLVERPLGERRRALETFAKANLHNDGGIVVSSATTDVRTARKWFGGVGAVLDGVVAKRLDLDYRSGTRDGMVKVKSLRTADCVVGGFRYASKSKVVGSLLLGLYDDDGLLNHVGFCSTFKASERAKLTKLLEPLIQPPGFTGQAPGGPSRWSTERSTQWQPLAAKMVAEVRYDHFTGGRFRHGTKFLRWRPDKSPRQCTMAQVQAEAQVNPLAELIRQSKRLAG
jgi:ATP-dependent DNA ligase